MKKSIFTLVAFMLLGLSFAKAQLVTTYDLTFQRQYSRNNINVSEFQNTKSKILINANLPKDRSIASPFMALFNLTINEVSTALVNPIINSGFKGTAFKIGNRTHVISWNEKNKKCLYGFFDDQPDTKGGQPDPRDEYNKIAEQKGF